MYAKFALKQYFQSSQLYISSVYINVVREDIYITNYFRMLFKPIVNISRAVSSNTILLCSVINRIIERDSEMLLENTVDIFN